MTRNSVFQLVFTFVGVLLLVVTVNSQKDSINGEIRLATREQTSYQFVCPLYRKPNTPVRFYKEVSGARTLLNTTLSEQGTKVEINPEVRKTIFVCEVDGSTKLARLTIYAAESPDEVLSKLTYDKTIFINSSSQLNVQCPISDSSVPVAWRRPPQYIVSNNNNLEIKDATTKDFGIYYCPRTADKFNRIIIKDANTQPRPNSILDNLVWIFAHIANEGKPCRYRCPLVTSPLDQVVWHQPADTILLEQSRDYYTSATTAEDLTNPFYCEVTNPNNASVARVAQIHFTPPLETEHSTELDYNINFSDYFEESTRPIEDHASLKTIFNLICVSEEIPGATYVWKLNGITIGTENILKLDSSDSAFGTYECVYTKPGVPPRKIYRKFLPGNDSTELKLAQYPGNLFYVKEGKSGEIHCEIPHRPNNPNRGIDTPIPSSSDVTWTLNNKKIFFGNKTSSGSSIRKAISPTGITRNDRMKASILRIRGMSQQNEGLYTCYVDDTVQSIQIFMLEAKFSLEVEPEHDIVNVGGQIEFHCQVRGDDIKYTAKDIKWQYIPKGKSEKIPILDNLMVETEDGSSSNFLVSSRPILKANEGHYFCYIGKISTSATLIVIGLEITPKVQTIPLGGNAKFICITTGKNALGKLSWRREDGKGLGPHEKIIPTSNDDQLMLMVELVEWDNHNTTYVCSRNGIEERAILYVKGDCEYGYKPCKNGDCLQAKVFCDGKSDCADESDEICDDHDHCLPNEFICKALNGTKPEGHCLSLSWKCDGEDDCGNGYDESECPIKNKGKCLGTHYLCNKTNLLIPRNYWCDGEHDCESGEDEEACAAPQFYYPTKNDISERKILKDGTIELTCKVSGRPLPTIVWRYNWGPLPQGSNSEDGSEKTPKNVIDIKTTYEDCTRVISTLRIDRADGSAAGIYTCEALAQKRVMGPDQTVYILGDGKLCAPPMFNAGAYYEQECLQCFCSGKTTECTSANGYVMSPKPKSSSTDEATVRMGDYASTKMQQNAVKVIYTSKNGGLYFPDIKSPTNDLDPDVFLRGDFGLSGSWVSSYGFNLQYNVSYRNLSGTLYDGPYFVLYSKDGQSKLFRCFDKNMAVPIPPIPNILTVTEFNINLKEYSQWYTDKNCTNVPDRAYFMNVLKNVMGFAIRVKYYTNNDYVGISRISLEYAFEHYDKTLIQPLIEQCKCPEGFWGLSCEITN